MQSRITISVPDELAEVITREAKRRGESVSALVREALESYLRGREEEPRELPFVGAGRSGTKHTARNAEKVLAREWGRDRDR